jgi:putative tricarboxylic transport membrane protein
MRRAEIVAAAVLALFSAYAAAKSTELPIDWVRGRGPGGGMFPFYLSLIMLASCLIVMVRGLMGRIPAAWVDKPYFTRVEFKHATMHAGSLVVALASIYVIGTYGAIVFLLVTHMRFLGKRKHGWGAICAMSVATPVVIFLFFEILMQQILPKGLTDPLFYPLFAFFNAPAA